MRHWLVALLFLVVAPLMAAQEAVGKTVAPAAATLTVQGKVIDRAGNPVGEAHVVLNHNGKPVKPPLGQGEGHSQWTTGRQGLFRIEIQSDPNAVRDGQWSVKITRPSFRPSQAVPLSKIHTEESDDQSAQRFIASVQVIMERQQGAAFWIALVVFLLVYLLIAFELLHRTTAAFSGAALLLLITHTFGTYDDAYKIITYEQALHTIDWNVVFLLMGMMIIVGALKESGVFQWLAYKTFQVARGNILALSAALCIVTAVASAFLDNVTAMLLLTPVTIELALVLGVSPFVFLLPEVVASNIGGTATLIGDPPNIMIGSYARLTFNDFLLNLTPVVIVVLAVQLLYNKVVYGHDYRKAKVEDVPQTIAFLRERYQITDRRVLAIAGTVLLGVILLFVLHGTFHMEVCVPALFGAALIVVLCRMNISEILEREVEWSTLVFFIMLFMVVGGAEQTGILQAVADWILGVCKGNLTLAVLLVLWASAIASAIVDNIPFTATMLPITAYLGRSIEGAESGILWWALALGACFGGNGTIIGASANVVTVGIAERSGHRITFFEYLKQAGPITVVSLIISSLYLLIRC